MKYFWQGMGYIVLAGLGALALMSALFTPAPVRIISILGGGLLAILFVSSGFVFFYRAAAKDARKFQRIVVGGILGRLLALTGLLILVMTWEGLEQVSFLISLFASYFILQIWEVISFNHATVGNL